MIYLDHHATTPVRPEVRAAMAPWWGVPANPASAHRAGQRAAAAVEHARAQVAALVGGPARGVVFTSGATEANHLAIRGVAAGSPGRIVSSALEHPCVAAAVAATGAPVTRWRVDGEGRLVVARVPDDTVLVTVNAVQHETGVVADLDAVRAATGGAWLHVDAAQAAGRQAPQALVGDSVSVSSHKIGGPPGVGALMLAEGREVVPLFAGAQERGRRGGTVPTALVVGFGEAAVRALAERAVWGRAVAPRAARLERALVAEGARVVGAGADRAPGTVLVVVPGLPGELLVQALDRAGVCVSAGAACASGSAEPSTALVAMGDPDPRGAVRFSMGPTTTDDDIDRAIAAWRRVLPRVREATALTE